MKAVICIDDASMLSSQEEESARIKSQLITECGDIFTFVDHPPERLYALPRCDLAVVDYGGLTLGFSSSGPGEMCSAQLVKAIEDRPGTLFLIWSLFTENWYLEQIQKDLKDNEQEKIPDNVLLYRTMQADGRSWKGRDDTRVTEFWDKVRTFLGVQKPEFTPELEAAIDAYDMRADALLHGRLSDSENVAQQRQAAARIAAQPVAPAPPEDEPEPEPEEVQPARAPIDVLAPWPGEEIDEAKYCIEQEDGGIKYGEVIGHITIPLRLRARPGINSFRAAFKLADCIVDLCRADDVQLASFGGGFGGCYEFTVCGCGTAGNESITMFADPRDIWKAFDIMRLEFLRQHPEFLPSNVQAQT